MSCASASEGEGGAAGAAAAAPMMSDPRLGQSLTSMDWLPRVNVGKTDGDGKPSYSYANLITFAINSVKDDEKKMTLADIYKWIEDNFPYYQSAGNGWKVRRMTPASCNVQAARHCLTVAPRRDLNVRQGPHTHVHASHPPLAPTPRTHATQPPSAPIRLNGGDRTPFGTTCL